MTADVQKETTQVIKDIVFMYEPKARFVSLVGRSANKTPFKVVKNEKEIPMKVLQSIVAQAGTDVEAIKAAFDPEVRDALKLTEAEQFGKFVTYIQGPREAFKADSLEVVALKEDNSLLGIQGELVEPDENFIVRAAKLFKSQKQEKYVATEDGAPIDAEVLKSQLSSEMWGEVSALRDALYGILEQRVGTGQEKLELCKTVCKNFLDALELGVTTLKCDSFDFTSFRKAKDDVEKGAAAPEKIAEPEKPAEKAADAPSDNAEPNAAAPETSATPDINAVVAKATDEAAKAMKSIVDEAVKPLAETVKSIQEEVAKMQKTPLTVVRSNEDDGVPVKKGEKSNIFAGCFGSLAR
jgi:hypothetical protein